ncbi:hypothetical protein L0222_15795 [bacterium]|nr:hypothetical protein [bacterium]MCI0601604.1 hypothetical protein [bacterium]
MKSTILVLVLIAAVASATTIKRFTDEELRTGANSVVLAQVAKVQYETQNGNVWTIVTLQVERNLKGNSNSSVQFRIPGGQQSIDGRTLVTRVDGVPEMRNNERGVFFLESLPPAYPSLYGWNQGFYRIVRKNDQEYAVRSDGTKEPKKMEDFLKDFQKDSGRGR